MAQTNQRQHPTPHSSTSIANAINTDTDSSCSVYQRIEQSDTPIDIKEFKQTPNGINIYSDNLSLQVKRFQPCKADVPFNKSPEVLAQYHEFEKPVIALNNTINEDEFTPEDVALINLSMAIAYYSGEFVPKDDNKAVQYLSKVVDYYQNEKPEWSPLLSYMVTSEIVSKKSHLSENNPIRLQHETEAGIGIVSSYLLDKAGHFDTKAMLTYEDIEHFLGVPILPSNEDIKRYITPKLDELTHLANQGSYVATGILAELYEELVDIDPNYTDKAKYWEDKADALPQDDIDWR
ncbi:SEL1-like repeat protein [Psychrobacter sp. FDAARGOS_221]|uniref:SEL1-like repeat protein n=1 Tax=Psychrobacter sp. FDAARGOS_221 TaxID=1975705 RepID=UPI000FD7911B|nr:SEL1-like repeat protein [Psychrobacter sp. FDAARGOS_221]